MKLYRKTPDQDDILDTTPAIAAIAAVPAATVSTQATASSAATAASASVQPFAIRFAMGFASLTMVTLCVFLIGRFVVVNDSASGMQIIEETLSNPMFWSAIMVGFLAQAIDGALGMAYGITSTTFLLSAGASPAMASASVHIAEVFTTGVSGVSHAKLGNVDKKLFLRLLVPGIIGAVLGAVFVTQIDGKVLKPYIAAYLLIMGIYIITKAWGKIHARTSEPRHVGKLALLGGFVDSAGGGGWGPVVTTTLVGSGNDPRTTIGSVNFAEFFLALAGAASFTLLIGSGVWVLVLGLVIGGLFAAPFAALLTKKMNVRVLLILVGTLVSITSIFNLYKALFA